MGNLIKKFLCMVMAAVLLLGFAGPGTVLASEEQEVFPEGSNSADAQYIVSENLGENETMVDGPWSCLGPEPESMVAGDEEHNDSASVGSDLEMNGISVPDPENFYPEEFETESASGEIQAENEMEGATTYLTASSYNVSLYKGNSAKVTMSARASGTYYLQYYNTNTSAFSCAWGSWSGYNIPLTITGKQQGSGYIYIYLKNYNTGQTLKTISIRVTTLNTAKLQINATSARLEAGNKQDFQITVSGYSGSSYVQYSVANSSVAGASWGSWSGNTIPLTITGKNAGSTIVYIYWKDSSNKTLASGSISITVYQINPTLTLSATSASMNAGNSAKINVTVNNPPSGSYWLCYSSSNSSAYSCTWGSWSGNKIPLTITGKNAGSGKVTISLKNASGTVLTSATINPVTIKSLAKPSVTASPASLSLKAGNTGRAALTVKDTTGSYYLQYSTTNTSAYSCSWDSGWSGSTIYLNITGKAQGSGYVTVYLKSSGQNVTLASARLSVTVAAGPSSDAGIQSVGYSFSNYSKEWISLANCKRMFGDTQYARTVYNRDIGNGGVCFGMATSSGLLDYGSGTPYITNFKSGASKIYDLSKSNYSSTYGIYLSDFIEGMHITQVATTMSMVSGSSTLYSKVQSEAAQKKYVVVCMYGKINGQSCGHAVLAYGVDSGGKIKIYDSNYPNTTRYLTVDGSSWSYPITNSVNWTQSGGTLRYIPYSTYYAAWSNQGSLRTYEYSLLAAEEDELEADGFIRIPANYNLLVADADDDFEIRTPDDALAGTVTDGLFEPQTGYDDIYQVLWDCVRLDVDGKAVLPETMPPVMLYLPKPAEGAYQIVNSGTEQLNISLVDEKLAVNLETTAGKFRLYADDAQDDAYVDFTPAENVAYTVTLDRMPNILPSQYEGAYFDEIMTTKGSGTNTRVRISMNQMENAILPENQGVLEDVPYSYTLRLGHSAGGRILEEKITNPGTENAGAAGEYEEKEYKAGSSVLLSFKPDENCYLKAIYVDGKLAQLTDLYQFENLDANHTVYAEFVKDINSCKITLDGAKLLIEDGTYPLELGVDYNLSYSDDEKDMYILAAEDSGYYGFAEKEVDLSRLPVEIVDASFDAETGLLSFRANPGETAAVRFVAAVYDGERLVGTYLSGEVQGQKIQVGGSVEMNASFPEMTLPENYRIRIFMLDTSFKPAADAYDLPQKS